MVGNTSSPEGNGADDEGNGSSGIAGSDSGTEGTGAASVDGAGSVEGSVGSVQAALRSAGAPLDQPVRTIMNYRNKGGGFTTAADIRKIWGLKKEEADRLIPYIRIATQRAMGKENTGEKVIDINTATAEEWKSLPGIGEVLSNRIVRFRDKIGGFGSIQEVSKTYGLRDSVFQKLVPYLKLDSTTIKPQ